MMNMIPGYGKGNPKNNFKQTSAYFNPAIRNSVVEEVSDCIGIDFGNNNICVSYYKNQLFHVFQVESKSLMPACVTLKENEFFVGVAAKTTQKQKTTKLAVFDIRRCLTSGKADYENIPFKFNQDLVFENDSTSLPLGRSIAILLHEIKKQAEKELEQPIKTAVLTIPISFTVEHQQILVNACRTIGLKVLKLLFEPIATGITYYVAKENEKKSICVVDFGGAKLDVANISIDNGKIELLNYQSDLKLGGRDFDEKLVEFVLRHLKDVHPKIKLQQRHFIQIRDKCIAAKESLTSRSEANISLDFGDDDDIIIPITRKEFESLCEDLFQRVVESVKVVIKEGSNFGVSDVVLVGGSTRIPKVQQDLQKLFPHLPLNKTVNADEAIAKGAAMFGASLTGYIKTLTVVAEIPWDEKPPAKGSKMEAYIDEDGKVRRRITEAPNENYKFDVEKEIAEIRKIFEKNDSVNRKINEDETSKKLIEEANVVLARALLPESVDFRQRNQINIYAITYLNHCVYDFTNNHNLISAISSVKQSILQANVALNASDVLQRWEPAQMTEKCALLKQALAKLSLDVLIGDQGLQRYDEFIKLYDQWLEKTYTLFALRQKNPSETSKKEKAIYKELDLLENYLNNFLQSRYSTVFDLTSLNNLITALSEKINQKNPNVGQKQNNSYRC